MKELNELIAEINKPKVKVELIPEGFQKNCKCSWKYEHPYYSCGMFVIQTEVDVFGKRKNMIKKFVEADRWFCPTCGIELVKK